VKGWNWKYKIMELKKKELEHDNGTFEIEIMKRGWEKTISEKIRRKEKYNKRDDVIPLLPLF
jgi:hypothetical protein